MFGPNPGDASSAFAGVSGYGFMGGDSGTRPVVADPATYDGPFAGTSILGQPIVLYIGAILLLVALKFLSEHDATELDPADLHIGGYNVLAVGTTAVLFIVAGKVITAKYAIPGLSQLFAYV